MQRVARTAILAQPFEHGAAAQEARRGAAFHVHDLAAEHALAAGFLQHRVDHVVVLAPRAQHYLAQPDGLADGVENAVFLTSAPLRGLAGGGGGTHLDHHLAAQALDPGGRRGARDDDLVVADVGHGQRIHGQAAHGEAGHLGLGIGAAHAVGVHHRQAHQRGHHEGLQAVAAADFQRHDGAEALAAVFLHHAHRLDREMRIGQPFLADQRRAHAETTATRSSSFRYMGSSSEAR